MTKEVYEALKTRVTVTAKAENLWHWEFDNEGLNRHKGPFDKGYVDKMCRDVRMKSGNLWNVCEQVLKYLSWFHGKDEKNIEERLIANPLKK